jgi:hypothetical protein
VGHPHFSII